MKYALIEAERGSLPVQRACHVLHVSVSGYYAWQQRRQRAKTKDRDEHLVAHIRAVFADSRGTYGSPRVTAALRKQGMVCNRKRVARLMRQHGLVAKHRRQRRVRTTDSRHAFPIAPNRLQREFSAERPNEKWVADFTYIDTAEGWLYLALVLDIFSRKIVGWAMDEHMGSDLVERALRMAFAQRQPAKGELLHHSDRGSQYASFSYQRLLASQDVIVSMSGTGDPYDNALMESCIGTLKTECADYRFPSRQVARVELFAYLVGWYNRLRLHSALGYLSPDQFEQHYFQDKFLFHSAG
ncbi:MAG: IS3 family transposase [Anaerolineae bacterium]